MSSEQLIFEKRGSVAWLTLNRPAEMNSLNLNVVGLMLDYVNEIESDDSIRVLVIAATGRAFCAGADLKEAQAGWDNSVPGEQDFVERLNVCLDRIRDMPKPVICAINGITLAGGMELALTADIIIASEKAALGDGHANFGVYPGAGGAALLPRVLPHNVAKYLLLTGEALSAEEMKTYGLVNKVVPHDGLVEQTQRLADKLSGHSPIAMARMKAVANKSMDGSRSDALLHEQVELRRHMRSLDVREGLAAFVEKRKPAFVGK